MVALYTNNASTVLASAINTSATSITVTTGQGTLFPNPTSPNYFLITLQASGGGSAEIVKCTARSGDVLTIVRAQEGTTAASWSIGTVVELRVTAGELTTMLTTVNATGTGVPVLNISPSLPSINGNATNTPTVFNDSAGNESGRLVRAWVMFSNIGGSANTSTIYNSFNVSALTRNSAGDFTVTYTRAIPNGSNACVVGTTGSYVSASYAGLIWNAHYIPSTTNVTFNTVYTTGGITAIPYDFDFNQIAVVA